MEVDPILANIFGRQHGAATDGQVRAAGVTARQQAQLIASGLWVRGGPGVIVVAGAPATWHRRASIAVLGSGTSAALSHGAAARLHGLDGYARYADMHVSVPRGRNTGAADARRHTVLELLRSDTVTVDGIRAMSIPLAIIGCIAVDGRDRAGQALDGALRDGRSPAWFAQVATRCRRRGRSGPGELLAMLDERTERRLPRSWFQRLAGRALTELGVKLIDEHPVHDQDGRLLAELDLADLEHHIGVECQSWRWHSSPAAQRADSRRKRALRRLGWEIVDVWWSDLDRLDDVVATIDTIRNERSVAG